MWLDKVLIKKLSIAFIGAVPFVLPIIHDILLRIIPGRQKLKYVTYKTPEDEEKYWETAQRCRRRIDPRPPSTPLVQYYTPRLPPRMERQKEGDAVGNSVISTRTFCRWHKAVFPERPHPTVSQVQKIKQNYSTRDQQEMGRIVRHATRSNAKESWRRWIETKGPDITILFGEEDSSSDSGSESSIPLFPRR